jgi:hypothetical protein
MNTLLKRYIPVLFLSVLTGFLFSCKTGITEKKIIAHSENQVSVMLEEISLVKQNNNAENLVSPRTLDYSGNLVWFLPRTGQAVSFPV